MRKFLTLCKCNSTVRVLDRDFEGCWFESHYSVTKKSLFEREVMLAFVKYDLLRYPENV